MKKRLLFLCSNMNVGGFQKSLINLLMYIDYDKYDVDLLLVDNTGIFMKYINTKVNIICFNEYTSYFESFKISLEKLLKEKKYKLVLKRIVNSMISFIDKGYGAIYMSKVLPAVDGEYYACIDYCGQCLNYYMIDKIKSEKKITYFHSDYSKWDYYYKADKKYYQYSDAIITVSDECVLSMKKYFPQYSNKIYCVENIITSEVINNFIDLSNDKSNLDLFNKGITLVTVGRLCLDKGIDLAIDTAIILKEKYKVNFQWLWIGPGNIGFYKKKVKEMGLNGFFIFIGPVDNPYIYMKQADLIIHPARFEGKAVAVEESLVLNKPIIATDYSTVHNQIHNNKNGIIVPFQKEKLADMINKMISNKGLLQEIIKYQKIHCIGNENEIDKFNDILEGNV